MDNPFFWIYINFDPLHWRSFFVTNAMHLCEPHTKLFFSFQGQFKTLNVMLVIFLLANFLVPKLYLYLMFCTIFGLHLDSLHDLNSCFVIWLLDPSFWATNFESPFDSYYFVDLNFFDFLVCFWLQSLYSLHRLNLHFLLSKDLVIQIFKKIIFSKFWHL